MIFADPPYFLSNGGISYQAGKVVCVDKGEWDKGGTPESIMEFNRKRLTLYRRERTLYRTEKDLQLLINHEKDFFTGTSHEQDSIKQLIRNWEHKRGHDKTFLYFNPTED